MPAFPVVVVLPLSKTIFKVLHSKIDRRPEFLQICLLRPLYLSIQVRRGWLDGTELDLKGHQLTLYLFGKELSPSVCLNSLDREGHLLDDPIQKMDRLNCASSWVNAEHSKTCTVIDSRELIDPRSNLADIHLDAIPWNGS